VKIERSGLWPRFRRRWRSRFSMVLRATRGEPPWPGGLFGLFAAAGMDSTMEEGREVVEVRLARGAGRGRRLRMSPSTHVEAGRGIGEFADDAAGGDFRPGRPGWWWW